MDHSKLAAGEVLSPAPASSSSGSGVPDWSSHPEAKQRLNRILGGASSREDWFHDHYLSGRMDLEGLSLGAGSAVLPLRVLKRGALKRLEIRDSRDAALAAAKEEAGRLGLLEKVGFLKSDPLTEKLKANSYDVILFADGLGSSTSLDETLRACEVALRPGGVVWVPARIGPGPNNFPAAALDLVRSLHASLDPALKSARSLSSPEPQAPRPGSQSAAATPASEVELAMRRIFDVVDLTPTYGALPAILWGSLNQQALVDTQQGRDLVKALLELDLVLVDSGRLPHDSGYLVARKLTRPQGMAKNLGIDPFGASYRRLQEILGRRPVTPETAAHQKRRRAVSERFLEGDGIEIGALHSALPVGPKARVTYVDRLLTEGLRDQYPELSGLKLARVDVVDDGERLLTFPEQSLDFIIANHMLEHCENFLGTLRNHLSKLKTGGCLYYAVPDKRYSHDEGRPLTPFEHLVRDDQDGPSWSRKEHFLEWANLVEGARNERDAELRAETLMGMNYSIHFHVWDDRSFEAIVRQAHGYLGATFTTEWLSQNESELILVLRKTEPGQGVHLPAA